MESLGLPAARLQQSVRHAILMFHPPSLRFPHGHLDTWFLSAPSLPNCSRPKNAGPAHFRTSGEEFGYLADPTHSTGYEPKEFNQITSADGDTTPINDPNYDNISDFSMFEASVSHVSQVSFLFREKAKKACIGKPLLDRERRKRRFCDQHCRVDVEETSTEQY